jgi:hypothetical protein
LAFGVKATPGAGPDWAQVIPAFAAELGGVADVIDAGGGSWRITTSDHTVLLRTTPTTVYATLHQPSFDRLRQRLVDGAAVGEGPQAETWRPGQLSTLITPAGIEIISELVMGRGWWQQYPDQRSPAAQASDQVVVLLNDLRLHGHADPVATWESWSGARPADALGKAFTWDETWQSYTSPTYGHPESPRAGPAHGALTNGWERLRCGLLLIPLGAGAVANPAPAAVAVEPVAVAPVVDATDTPADPSDAADASAAEPDVEGATPMSRAEAFELQITIDLDLK